MSASNQKLKLALGTTPAPSEEADAPVYRRIQVAVRARINSDDWAPGTGIPNRTQLCKEFGTTRVTLDKAIQGLVAEGLLRSAGRVGTFVSSPDEMAARALRIGVVIASETAQLADTAGYDDNFYFGPLFQGIRDSVSGQSVDTVYAHLQPTDYLRFCRNAKLDGLILIAPRSDQLAAFHLLHRSGIFFVAAGISSADPADSDLPCQDTDNRQGGRDAALHLIGLGHRNIALLNMATTLTNYNDRAEGFCLALAEAGLRVDPSNLVEMTGHEVHLIETRMRDWLTRTLTAGTIPTAVFACDYQMALTALRVLRCGSLRVPEDISLVGFDDPFSAEYLTPALTTVRQPIYQMGRRAAERLLAGIREGQRPTKTELLRTEFIVRASTGMRPA